jgi:hypothetical protein
VFRRTQAKKRAEEKSRVRTPDAVSGRQNMEVQTELYLEELTDRCVCFSCPGLICGRRCEARLAAPLRS